jgi:HEPN domain-containing protein
MDKMEMVNFWIKSANDAFEMTDFLYENKKYADSLFYGQLALEKLLKAVYIARQDNSPPFVHDLLFLANKTGLQVPDDFAKDLKVITGFNINARYDDYKESFRKEATKDYAATFIDKIKEIKNGWKKKSKNNQKRNRDVSAEINQ